MPGATNFYVNDYVSTQSDVGRGTGLVSALAALPAQGATLYADALNYNIGTAALTNDKSFRFVGVPGLDGSGTRIISTATNTTALALSGAAVRVEDISLVHTYTGTRSAGLVGLDLTQANFAKVDNVLIDGFSTNLRMRNGVYYTVRDFHSRGSVVAGLEILNSADGDAGDMTVEGCTFERGSDTVVGGTAVLWRSGGGLRFENCKINGGGFNYPFQHGLVLDVADGSSTGIVLVVGNSIENCTGDSVAVKRTGTTGNFGLGITIVGNEIAPYRQGGGSRAIYLDVACTNTIVEGNSIHETQTGIDVDKLVGATIGHNTITAVGTGGVGVRVRSAATNVHVHPQAMSLIGTAAGYQFDAPANVRAHEQRVLAAGAAVPVDTMPGAVIYRTA